MKKFLKTIITLIVCTITLISCNSKKSTNAEESVKKLTVTYVTSPLNVPSILEKENKVFEKFLPGVEINYAEITSGADQSQALASGDVQILHAIGGSSVIAAASNGADIKILNMYSRAPEAFALFSKDKSLTTPTSLKGKTIAGPFGTNLHELLVSYLKSENLSIKDVNFVNMSIPDAFAAVNSGSIDVALLGGPAGYKAEKAGLHKITDGKGYIEAIICVATTQKFYNEHKFLMASIILAQKDLRKFMTNSPNDTKEIVKKALKLDNDAFDSMYKQYDFNIDVTENDIKGLQKTADFMFENEMIKNKVDARSLFIK